MSNAYTHGMNVQEVRGLATFLRTKSGEIDAIISAIESKVAGTTWVGSDANMFKNDWWPGHRTALQNIAGDHGLRGFAQSADNNATEQENVSGH